MWRMGGEIHKDSLCSEREREPSGPFPVGDDVETLRQQTQYLQQRVEFLDNMHQQALKQLRKTREDLQVAQQQRFREADKVAHVLQFYVVSLVTYFCSADAGTGSMEVGFFAFAPSQKLRAWRCSGGLHMHFTGLVLILHESGVQVYFLSLKLAYFEAVALMLL